MRTVRTVVNRLLADADGQDLIEYGLLVGLITLAAFLTVTAVGTTINGLFWQVIANGLASSL